MRGAGRGRAERMELCAGVGGSRKFGEVPKREGEGMKTVLCVCVCIKSITSCSVCVCVSVLAGCVCSSINVPGLISHTTLCSSLADGTT